MTPSSASAHPRESWQTYLAGLAAAGSAGLLAGAFAFQHLGGLPPCPMCIWQRWPYVAVLGLSLADVKSLCDESGAELCNINSDSQLVIGGTPEAVAAASTLAEERGARRVVALNVSGAFHSSLMAPAAEGMRETLRQAEINDPRLPVIANVSVEPLRDAEAVRTELGEQVRNPVRWSETVQRLVAEGADSFVEIGPGNVLTGLVRSIARPLKPTLVNLNSVESVRDESAEHAE